MGSVGAIEVRPTLELRSNQHGLLVGYAATFNASSRDLGGFTESIRPGAFKRSLAEADHILALYDHDHRSILGRCGAGTLNLKEDEKGLYFEIDTPPTSVGQDLTVLVRRGDIAGASFGFQVPKGGDVWSERDGYPHRELIDVDLHEITITANPAYLDTSVAKRHLAHSPARWRLNNARNYLDTVR